MIKTSGSDIWDDFEKEAISQGLISVEAKDKKTKKEKTYNKPHDDAIRLLYGIEPETIFKSNDLIEVAHPETAIVSDTYDAMNAVVENENQRHDIFTYIALRQPDGKINHRRYVAAKSNLINSLVKAGFTLDNSEEEDLMSLADSCARRLNDEQGMVKEAVAPLAVAAIALPVALLLGGVIYSRYGATSAQNVYANSQQVLESLAPLMNQPYANGIKQDVATLMRLAQNVYALKNNLAQVDSVDKVVSAVEVQANKSKIDNINANIQEYMNQLQKVYSAIPSWVAKIKMVHSTNTNANPDWSAKLIGWLQDLQWEDHEALIDKLWGSSKIPGGSEGNGGLFAAIQKDIKTMSAALNAANNQTASFIRTQQIQQQSQNPQGLLEQVSQEKPTQEQLNEEASTLLEV